MIPLYNCLLVDLINDMVNLEDGLFREFDLHLFCEYFCLFTVLLLKTYFHPQKNFGLLTQKVFQVRRIALVSHFLISLIYLSCKLSKYGLISWNYLLFFNGIWNFAS